MACDALIVGINSYQHQHLPNLASPSDDANAVAELLTRYSDFNVTPLPTVVDQEANKIVAGRDTSVTLDILKQALSRLFTPGERDIPDTALFYFSGHGLRDTRGVPQGYLATSDCNPDGEHRGLSLPWLRRLLVNSPVRQQVIILDCCFAGELHNFADANPEDNGRFRDRCFIAATRSYQEAFVEINGNHSFLTAALLKALDPTKQKTGQVDNFTLAVGVFSNRNIGIQNPVINNFGEQIILTRCGLKDVNNGSAKEKEPKNNTQNRERLPTICSNPPIKIMVKRSMHDLFIGRVGNLWSIHDILHEGRGDGRVRGVGIVTGMCGIGKTQLAVEYVHRFGDFYQGGIFWVEAEHGISSLINQLSIDLSIKVNSMLTEQEQLQQVFKNIISASNGLVLIVINNFTEKDHLKCWLPPSTSIRVLVTTRRKDFFEYSNINLKKFTTQEGLELLNLGNKVCEQKAENIVKLFGGHPQALRLASYHLKYLNYTSENIDKFIDDIDKKGELIDFIDEKEEIHSEHINTNYSKPISAMIRYSWEQILPYEKTLLALIAHLAPIPIPKELLKKIIGNVYKEHNAQPRYLFKNILWAIKLLGKVKLFKKIRNNNKRKMLINRFFHSASQDYFDDAVARLTLRIALIENNNGQIMMHRLISSFIRTKIKKDNAACNSILNVFEDELNEFSKIGNFKSLCAFHQTILPHIEFFLFIDSAAAPEKKIELSDNISKCHCETGNFGLSKKHLTECLKICKNSNVTTSNEIAILKSNLANTLQHMGEYEESKRYYEEALDILQNLNKCDEFAAEIFTSYGTLLRRLGDIEKAKEFLKNALDIDMERREPGHPDIASSQANLAGALKDLNMYEEAKELYEKAICSSENHSGNDNWLTAKYKTGLAMLLRHLGELDKSKDLLEDAIRVAKAKYKQGDHNISIKQSFLSIVLRDLGKIGEARRLARSALEAEKLYYENGHPEIAIKQYNLALLEKDSGNIEEAEKLAEEAYNYFFNRFGPNFPRTKRAKDIFDNIEN